MSSSGSESESLEIQKYLRNKNGKHVYSRCKMSCKKFLFYFLTCTHSQSQWSYRILQEVERGVTVEGKKNKENQIGSLMNWGYYELKSNFHWHLTLAWRCRLGYFRLLMTNSGQNPMGKCSPNQLDPPISVDMGIPVLRFPNLLLGSTPKC